MTAAKNPTHTRHPTPVRSAMRSILFIVPRSRIRLFSKESFIFSAREVESRISSPIATVIYKAGQIRDRLEGGNGKEKRDSTSFSIFTRALMPSTCSSFWDSSSERTASLYWPLTKDVLARQFFFSLMQPRFQSPQCIAMRMTYSHRTYHGRNQKPDRTSYLV